MFPRDAFALAPERVLEVRSGLSLPNHVVVVAGERIEAVMPIARLPAATPVQKLPGCTLLPGLIDVHVHAEDWELPLFLSHGITTIRDTGNDVDYILGLRERMSRPEAPGPAVLCCGPALDGVPYYHPVLNWGIATPDDMELAIRYLVERGVDAIKLYVGLDSPRVRRAVEVCSRLGMHLLGHFLSPFTLLEAVQMGVPETEHLAGVPSTLDMQVVDAIVSHSSWVVPTQLVWEAVLGHARQPDRWRELRSLAPIGPVTIHWENYERQMLEDPEAKRRLEDMCRNNRRYIAALVERDALLAPGTDAPALLSFPGASYHDELDVFADCGMPYPRVLRSASHDAARLLGIDDRTGSIEAGKLADLLVVEGDPTVELAALRRVRSVYKRGWRYDPSDLLSSSNPRGMRTGILPDISERAVEMVDWKAVYLGKRG